MSMSISVEPNGAVSVSRITKETEIRLQLLFPQSAAAEKKLEQSIEIDTGLGFLDHMLNQLAFYAGWQFHLQATGDLQVDEHHLIEDVAICIGSAINQFRSSNAIQRFGQRLMPMDESLVLAAVDVCGRGVCVTQLNFTREMMGNIATEMWPHFFNTLASQAGISLHLVEQYSSNNHHLIEGAFKGLGFAFKEALIPIENNVVLSTKGVLQL